MQPDEGYHTENSVQEAGEAAKPTHTPAPTATKTLPAPTQTLAGAALAPPEVLGKSLWRRAPGDDRHGCAETESLDRGLWAGGERERWAWAAAIKDLMGSDVNLVHRMMKNHVTETTGWQGYALFTDQGLGQMQAQKEGFVQQVETIEISPFMVVNGLRWW